MFNVIFRFYTLHCNVITFPFWTVEAISGLFVRRKMLKFLKYSLSILSVKEIKSLNCLLFFLNICDDPFAVQKKSGQNFNFSVFSFRTEVRFGRFVSAYYTWTNIYKYNSNQSPTRCNNFSVYYPDVYSQLNMFWAFSRPSSGAQWLQWQPLILPSYRDDSRAVFVVGPAGRPDHSAAGRIMSIKNSSDSTGNRTRDLPTCSAVPQPTAPPRAPLFTSQYMNLNCWCQIRQFNPSVSQSAPGRGKFSKTTTTCIPVG